jgi:hypothetical protein
VARGSKLSASMTITQFDRGYWYATELNVRLSQSTDRFARVPHGRYINFMSDFLAARKGATKAQAIEAWAMLNRMNVPNTYAAWARARSRKSK